MNAAWIDTEAAAPATEPVRPNVLFILCDDLRPDVTPPQFLYQCL